MNILAGTEKYISVIYNQMFAGKRNARQGLSVVTPASKKAVRKIVPKKSQRLSLLSSSFSAIWVIPLSLWLFSAACSTKVVPCNGDATADPENDCLPLPPGNLDMEDLGRANGGYRVHWEDMEGAEKYEMTKLCQTARVKLSNMNWGQGSDESVRGNSYMLGVMSPGQVCYMRVRTCNQFGCGRWIEGEFIIGLKPPEYPRPRVGGVPLTADRNGEYTSENNTFQIFWIGVTDASLTHYTIQEREGASGSWQAPGNGAGNSIGNIPLADATTLADDFTGDLTRDYGKNYFFRVKSCGIEGGAEVCGPWSSVRKLLLRLPPPANFSTSSTISYSGNYSLSWSAGTPSAGVSSASSVDRYQIEEITGGGNNGSATALTFSSALGKTYAKPVGTYSYRVRSCVAGSMVPNITCSAWSSTRLLVTVPSLLKVINVVSDETGGVSSDASYTISWNAVTGASQYEITESIGGVAQAPVKVSQASQNYTGKVYGKSYSYTVRACAGSNCGLASSSVSVEVKLSAPSIISPITASPSGNYTVSWQGVTHADSYDWQEASSSGASFSAWSTATKTSNSQSGVSSLSYTSQPSGSTFRYRVRACKDVSSSRAVRDCGEYSSPQSVSIGTIGQVSSLSTDETNGVSSDASYTISWNAVTGASQYEITEVIDGVAQTTLSTLAASATPPGQESKIYTGKAYGKTYSYTVKACAGSNCGPASSSVSVEVKLPAPTNLQASVPSSDDGNYTISWDAVAGAVGGYKLEESQDGGATWNYVMLTSDTSVVSHVFSNQAGEKGYAYRVRACAVVSGCQEGDPESSDWTTSANNHLVRVNYPVPTGVKITDTGASAPIMTDIDGSYDVRWTAMPHAHSYKIRVTASGQKKDGTPYADVIISYNTSSSTTPNSPLYSFSSRPGHRDYSYEVSACNAEGGCGAASTRIGVTVTLPSVTMLASDESPSYDGTYSVSWDSVLAGYDSTHSYHLEERVPVPGGAVTTWRNIDATGAAERNGRVHVGVNLGATALKGNYNYRVRACSDVGCAPRLPVADYLGVNFQSLGAPTNLQADVASSDDGNYTISWDVVADAVGGYLLEESQDGGATWNPVMLTSDTSVVSHMFSNQAGEKGYAYRVRACAVVSGCSASDPESSDWTTSANNHLVRVNYLVPMGVKITDTGASAPITTDIDGSYDVSWTAMPHAHSYKIRSTASGEKKDGTSYPDVIISYNTSSSTTPSSPLYSFSSRPGYRDYSYEVSACNAEGDCGAASTRIGVTVTLPSVTMLASDESPSYDGTYSVSWDSVLAGYDSTHSYHLEESVPGAVSAWRDIDATGAPERDDRVHFGVNLGATAPKGNYKYRVRACSDVGCVPRPPVANYLGVSFQLLGAPTLAVASGQSGQFTAYIGVGLVDGSGNPHDGSYTLAWGSVTGAVAYKLTEDGVVIPLPPGATTSRIPAKALASVHAYQLAACADAACSMATLSPSSLLSVTTRDLTPPVLISDESPSFDGSYEISWASVTGAMRYVLREKKGSGSGAGVYTEVYNGTVLAWQVPSAKTESTSYFYSLRVYGPSNIYAESAVESEVVVTLNCPSVTTVSWTVGTNTCSATTTAAVPHGQSVTLTDADGSHQGSVTATCNSGMLSVSSSSTDTCGVPGASQGFPTIITTYAELKTVKNGLYKHYRLGNDIDASPSRSEGASNCVAYNGSNGDDATCTGFTPIGDNPTHFTGSFDGAGHKITSLYIKRRGTHRVGLFSRTGTSAEIKNIGVTDAYVVGQTRVGGLIGDSGGTVSNSYATGAVTGSNRVGGLIGDSDGTVSNSYATGAVTGTSYNVGGLIGDTGGTVSNSYATGAVTGSNNVGGLIGSFSSIFASVSVSNSYATGAVTGSNRVGGLIGHAYSASAYATATFYSVSVSNSYATGTVTGTGSGSSVGGLIGNSSSSTVYRHSSFATVTGKNYFVDASGGSDGIGSGTCSGTCTHQTVAQIAGLASSSGWTVSTSGTTGNWDFGTTTQLPAVLYSGTSCETIATNDINSNDGDTSIPDCGDIVPGQPIAVPGSVSNPIIITSYTELKDVKSGLDKHYRLGNDIDASASWNEGASNCVAYNGSNGDDATCTGFTPIGSGSRNNFTGSLEGAGYKITNLYIKRPSTSYVGLFGYVSDAEIKNIGVTDVYIVGRHYVGGLLGSSSSFSSVSNSYAMGTVTGNFNVGGLIGRSHGPVSNSYATGAVTGSGSVGGLIGYSLNGSSVSNSYATGAVTGTGDYVGGLIGQLDHVSFVSNSYAMGAVTGTGGEVGGLIGNSEGFVSNSYATGAVTGSSNVGGLIGQSGGSVTGKNYFVDASGGTNGLGSGACSGTCERKTAAQIAALSSTSVPVTAPISDWLAGNWNFGTATQLPAVLYSGTSCETISGTNNINSNDGDTSIPDCGDIVPGQPIALGDAPSVPIIISTYAQLKTVKNGLDKHYRLGNNIDASPSWSEGASNCVAYNGSNGSTATCTGFTPIGNSHTNSFTGSFDGAGHKITKLYINRPMSMTGVGLFSRTTNNAEIKNIGVTDAYVVGQNKVGGLIGHSGGSVSNSYATGDVTGTGNNVGGLIGRSNGSVSNSYATGDVTGTGNNVGGLIGRSDGSVSNSYATGDVTGTGNNVGGLIGSSGGSVSNSYATGDVTGTGNNVGGLIGRSDGSVSNSYATGAVMGTGNNVGGLIGYSVTAGSVSNSYATGAVSGTRNVGGLIGRSDGSVSNSYATGAVTGTSSYVGGLIGGFVSGTVSNSYATGIVTGPAGNTHVGGLMGSSGGSVTGKNYFVDASGGSDGIGGFGTACLSSVCVRKTAADIAALTSSTTGWAISTSGTMGTVGNWNFGTATQLPAVLYSGTDCETISGTNNINSNEGDAKKVDCGDLLPGQR